MKKYIVRIALLIAFFAPNVNMYAFALQGVMPFVLYWCQNRHPLKLKKWSVAVITTIFVSFIVYCFSFGNMLDFKSVAMSMQLISLFLLFPFCKYDDTINNNFIYLCTFLLVGSQMALVFDIGFVKDLIDTYYPLETDKAIYVISNVSKADNLLLAANSRYYGIFRNPNAYSSMVIFLFAIYLIQNQSAKILHKLLFYILIGLSVFLTGSRTGMVVYFSLLLLDIGYDKQRAGIYMKDIIKVILLLLILGGFYFYVMESVGEVRSLSIDIDDESLGGRLAGFDFLWMTDVSVIHYLFGHFSMNIIESYYHYWGMDGDLGNLLFLYGGMMVVSLSYFYYWMLKKRTFPYYILLMFLLFSISGIIFTGVKTAYLYMLLVSYYNEINVIKK